MSRIVLLALLSGCAPYVEYIHLDATPLQPHSNDAYDLFCAGGVYGDRLTLDLGACKSLRNDHMFKFKIRYQ